MSSPVGELAAMVVVDAVARLVPGYSITTNLPRDRESFHNDLLDIPSIPPEE